MPHDRLSRREFTVGTATGVAAFAVGSTRAAPDTSARRLEAGAAQTVVAPTAAGTFLIGPMAPSTGINDELFARALVLSDGALTVAVITIAD